jgi:hypothetical protein
MPEFDNSLTCSYIWFVPADEAGIVFDTALARMAKLALLRPGTTGLRRVNRRALGCVLSKCCSRIARMAKLADALASGASIGDDVQVQVLFRALETKDLLYGGLFVSTRHRN